MKSGTFWREKHYEEMTEKELNKKLRYDKRQIALNNFCYILIFIVLIGYIIWAGISSSALIQTRTEVVANESMLLNLSNSTPVAVPGFYTARQTAKLVGYSQESMLLLIEPLILLFGLIFVYGIIAFVFLATPLRYVTEIRLINKEKARRNKFDDVYYACILCKDGIKHSFIRHSISQSWSSIFGEYIYLPFNYLKPKENRRPMRRAKHWRW